MRALVETLAADPGVNQVLYVQDTPPDLDDHDSAEWKATRDGLVTADIPGVGKALASGLPEMLPAPGGQSWDENEVTALAGIPTALAALRAHTQTSASAEHLRAIAAATVVAEQGRWCSEHEGKGLLASHGVTVPIGRVADSIDDAVVAAAELGGAVAMKISHPEIQHKTDIGGVVLGLTDPQLVGAAAEQLLALRPDAVVLIEEMASPGTEMLVSATRDGVVPALVIGTGGIWTELMQDVVVIPLPADPARISDALRSLTSYEMLAGGRGRTPLAVDALCELAAAVGRALVEDGLSLVELNPVIVTETSAVAVDAVVRH